MLACRWLFPAVALSLLLPLGLATAVEHNSFVGWALDEFGEIPPDPPVSSAFGTIQDQWNTNIPNVIGIAYDHNDDGIWITNEDPGTGNLYLQDDDAPHANIRTYNLLAYGLTVDGNSDGVAVDGARLLVTDFQGDLQNNDDIIMDINRMTGALNGHWDVDGAQNPNPNANLNTILGIAVGAGGTYWVSTNNGQVHNINLMAGGLWSRNSVIGVPGGGSWAEIDLDRCLNQYFVTNFQLNRHQYHNAPNAAPLQTFPGAAANSTGITSDNAGVVWTSGFSNNVMYRHEGIACATPVQATTWGRLKGAYR